jgi:DNA-binding transcriptional LysR family regulator
MTFCSGRRKPSNARCGAARFFYSLRDYYPGWRISLPRTCSMQRGRRATSALLDLTTSARLWSPRMCRRYANGRHQVQLEFLPWQSGIAELAEHGQVDLVLHIDDGLPPSHCQSERLYREDWICAVTRGSRFGDRLSLRQYLGRGESHRCIYLCRCADDPGQAVGGCRRTNALRVFDCLMTWSATYFQRLAVPSVQRENLLRWPTFARDGSALRSSRSRRALVRTELMDRIISLFGKRLDRGRFVLMDIEHTVQFGDLQ